MGGTVSFHISVGVLACFAYKRDVNRQFLLWPCSQETIKHSMPVCSPPHQLPQVSRRIERFWLLPKWAIFSNVWQNSSFTCVFHCHITTIYCMLHLNNFSAHCNVMQPVHYLSDWETVAGESHTGEDGAMHWQVGLDNCSFSFYTLPSMLMTACENKKWLVLASNFISTVIEWFKDYCVDIVLLEQSCFLTLPQGLFFHPFLECA